MTTSPEMIDLAQKMGGVIEALARARDDRLEFKDALAEVRDSLNAVKGGLANVEQALNATTKQVASIAIERCGTRLDRIETIMDLDHYGDRLARFREIDVTMKRWEVFLGKGKGIIWRVAGAAASTLVLAWIGAHVHF